MQSHVSDKGGKESIAICCWSSQKASSVPSGHGGGKSLQCECASIVNTQCQTLTQKSTFLFLSMAALRDPEIPKVG
jgi:hypothetical protein